MFQDRLFSLTGVTFNSCTEKKYINSQYMIFFPVTDEKVLWIKNVEYIKTIKNVICCFFLYEHLFTFCMNVYLRSEHIHKSFDKIA